MGVEGRRRARRKAAAGSFNPQSWALIARSRYSWVLARAAISLGLGSIDHQPRSIKSGLASSASVTGHVGYNDPSPMNDVVRSMHLGLQESCPFDGRQRIRPDTPSLGICSCAGRLAHGRTPTESRYLRVCSTGRTPFHGCSALGSEAFNEPLHGGKRGYQNGVSSGSN
jgi:hypothetical protein